MGTAVGKPRRRVKSTVNKFAMMLVLFALMGLPARARGDQETRHLLRALKTASLTRLTLALSPQRMPDLTPTMRSKALGHIKVANRKITTILANPKLSDEAKKKRLIQAQSEGAAHVVRELGPAEKSLKEAYLRLTGSDIHERTRVSADGTTIIGRAVKDGVSRTFRARHLDG